MKLNDSPHKRLNILTNEWVLVSPQRNKRPWQGKQEDSVVEQRKNYDEQCYLCPGNTRNGGEQNEEYTSTFVFNNDFAALLPTTADQTRYEEGLLLAEAETGECRVICFSPDHSLTMAEMSVPALEEVVATWKAQFEELAEKPSVNNVQIFENKGAIMGCSNPHPHGQIWAQNSIPLEIQKRTETQQTYFQKHGRSLLSQYLKQEISENERIVTKNDHFVALVPFWAVWPYEIMIIPVRHFSSIAEMDQSEQQSFAMILKEVTVRYDNLFQTSFPYSAGMQQRPTDGEKYEGWHFHYSFYPPLLRSATVKKFMVGYEMFANPQRDITAETVAETLASLPTQHYKLTQ
ncbi:galactose-1-phosphate uridylyltransferase [Marivirga lumbricoides]|uniref:Galactose-1-phosphate uridylyltransferase n=1 Tax=Marivirga lumbricoides TaxID=1046115 RepID=A0A2T4DSV9_9BACT|nr:galactose-1-phosphate uridylyltransferase [Marivirga lumbricoides]